MRMKSFIVNIINIISNTMNLIDYVICHMTLISYGFSQCNNMFIRSLHKMTN